MARAASQRGHRGKRSRGISSRRGGPLSHVAPGGGGGLSSTRLSSSNEPTPRPVPGGAPAHARFVAPLRHESAQAPSPRCPGRAVPRSARGARHGRRVAALRGLPPALVVDRHRGEAKSGPFRCESGVRRRSGARAVGVGSLSFAIRKLESPPPGGPREVRRRTRGSSRLCVGAAQHDARNVPPRPPGRVSDTHRRQIDPPPRRDRHARRTTPERHETAQALSPRCPGRAPMRGAGGKRPRAGVPRVDATGGAPRVDATGGAPRVGAAGGRRGEGAAAGRPARASAPPRAAGGPYSPIRSATRARWLRASPHWWALDRPRLSHRCRSCSQVKPMPPWTCSDAAGTRQPASEA
ncbi:MAG: hypothetical protein QOC78_4321 [Solirubrobacteraceae bacterium]|nr:hypothetical protein [Solirubrobacteraceae bacterium]